MRLRFKPTHVVLAMLCIMYFITYVDRVNIGTAASEIQRELHLSNTQLGLVFSAFAYPYLLFQVIGGWVGDGATFPTATRAMQYWTPASKRGFAQGLTHAFARLGNAATPPLIAMLMAWLTWRGSFIALGLVSLLWGVVWMLYFRNEPKDHPDITAEELATLRPRPANTRPQVPWGPLIGRMWPVTLTYFCYGWTLWLYLNWLPLFFKNSYSLDIKNSALFASGVFFAGVVGDSLGGILSDRIFKRTGHVRFARLSVIVLGFAGALASLFPILFTRDITVVALSLSGGFFFAELVIGPIWSVPMDIAPKYSGTAAGLMNTGSALAAIVSPLVAGYVIDVTGNWYLPFLMSMGLLLLGGFCAFLMHPEIPFDEGEVMSSAGRPVPAQ